MHFVLPIFFLLTLSSDIAVLNENDAFSILVLLTKQRYSSFFKKVFVLQKICFKVKVWKTFKTSTDCLIKTCRSLKWRVILKIPSIVYSFLDKLTLRSWISRGPTYFFEKASNCTQANVDTFTSLGSKQTKKPLPPHPHLPFTYVYFKPSYPAFYISLNFPMPCLLRAQFIRDLRVCSLCWL